LAGIFDSGHWGVTFQNWMLIAVAIVPVWIAFIWLTRQIMRDSWYFLVALVWLVIVFCDVRSMRKAPNNNTDVVSTPISPVVRCSGLAAAAASIDRRFGARVRVYLPLRSCSSAISSSSSFLPRHCG
jgi:hypothetical protein